MYDYIIVGTGPTGLALAWYLSQYKQKILLIDQAPSLGGCHRVVRQNGLFGEHGPRVYLMTAAILKEMGKSWHYFFTPYKSGFISEGSKALLNFNLREIFILIKHFFSINECYKEITMEEFLKYHQFSNQATKFIDRICRTSDGAAIDRYTLYEFLQLINQNGLYTIYQPKLPNDVGLFAFWEDKLLEHRVDIRLDTKVIDFGVNTSVIESIVTNNGVFYGMNVILAIPPTSLVHVLHKSCIPDAFGDIDQLKEWAHKTDYLYFNNITFHWKDKLDIQPVWGLAEDSEWGIASIVLSDYMTFNDPRSQTVISATLSLHNKSNYTGKTPFESSEQELINEIFRQMNIQFSLPPPDYAVPEYYEFGKTTAFQLTKYGNLDFYSKYYNLFICGTHNGYNNYSFTSMEAAVENATALLHYLIPYDPLFNYYFPIHVY